MGDQSKEILKYGLSGKKLHEGLTEDELVDVGEGKFKILISSPESLSEKKKYGLSYYYYAQKLCVWPLMKLTVCCNG